ncbi:hypothetical protein [Streptomyces sp. NPDC017991]|uniref:hypothetical protein n=1 Tax=Streptomyces sp. NPDC017991 TaxID=3365026 RepID=UPI0037932DF7
MARMPGPLVLTALLVGRGDARLAAPRRSDADGLVRDGSRGAVGDGEPGRGADERPDYRAL